jgi:hypothetical protein
MKRLMLAAAAVLAVATPGHAASLTMGTYFQETLGSDCSFGAKTVCETKFAAVPAGKTLLVSDASCMIRVLSTNTLNNLYLRGLASGGAIIPRFTFLPPAYDSLLGSQKEYLAQATISHGFLAGQRPQMVAEVAKGTQLFTMLCTIAGTLQ